MYLFFSHGIRSKHIVVVGGGRSAIGGHCSPYGYTCGKRARGCEGMMRADENGGCLCVCMFESVIRGFRIERLCENDVS